MTTADWAASRIVSVSPCSWRCAMTRNSLSSTGSSRSSISTRTRRDWADGKSTAIRNNSARFPRSNVFEVGGVTDRAAKALELEEHGHSERQRRRRHESRSRSSAIYGSRAAGRLKHAIQRGLGHDSRSVAASMSSGLPGSLTAARVSTRRPGGIGHGTRSGVNIVNALLRPRRARLPEAVPGLRQSREPRAIRPSARPTRCRASFGAERGSTPAPIESPSATRRANRCSPTSTSAGQPAAGDGSRRTSPTGWISTSS